VYSTPSRNHRAVGSSGEPPWGGGLVGAPPDGEDEGLLAAVVEGSEGMPVIREGREGERTRLSQGPGTLQDIEDRAPSPRLPSLR